ncbi:hypothetical protein [Actinoplanes subglobosus]|uniref:Polymer-forming cytoskeletal protein n=1 Tax=Actinoplanes subglobosus TaxID=1547892 RepID=A0ABV8INY4_9ACTN
MFFDAKPHPAWTIVPLDDVRDRYDLGEISQDSVYLEDLYGEEPEHFFVHHGDVAVDGPLVAEDDSGDEISTLYVIDGDLTVDGPAVFRNGDSNTALYVTGSVTVRSLVCLNHGQFFVGGSLIVEDLLFTGLDDAGHLVVHGPVTAGAWIEAAGRGAIYFPAPPAARLVGDPGNPYFDGGTERERFEDAMHPDLVDADGRPRRRTVVQAVLGGRPVLR